MKSLFKRMLRVVLSDLWKKTKSFLKWSGIILSVSLIFAVLAFVLSLIIPLIINVLVWVAIIVGIIILAMTIFGIIMSAICYFDDVKKRAKRKK
jgi:cytochrome c biogenesis protein CcdA